MILNNNNFWDWFQQFDFASEAILTDGAFLFELDKRISDFGNFVWEVGPGKYKPYSLVISPGGDVELLEDTKEFISVAPVMENWEFYFSRQIKEWKNCFSVKIGDENILVDVSGWEYVLFCYDDGMFDIELKPIPYMEIFDGDKYGIIEMVVDSIVGEELRLKKILSIEIVKAFDIEFHDRRSNIKNLRKHLDKLS
jgi:hypothetical protein